MSLPHPEGTGQTQGKESGSSDLHQPQPGLRGSHHREPLVLPLCSHLNLLTLWEPWYPWLCDDDNRVPTSQAYSKIRKDQDCKNIPLEIVFLPGERGSRHTQVGTPTSSWDGFQGASFTFSQGHETGKILSTNSPDTSYGFQRNENDNK